MIWIQNRPADLADLEKDYPQNSVERQMLSTMNQSAHPYSYDSKDQLTFELKLRREIIRAAEALYRSRFAFRVFKDTTVNPDFWDRTQNGGFLLKQGVKAADAVRDIYQNSGKYGSECATAMMIVYHKALLEVFGEEAYNRLFPSVYLMNWSGIDPLLYEVGLMGEVADFIPGDRLYFANPDVNPVTPEWQGENVILLREGLYYGHGAGRGDAAHFLRLLNANRREGATRSAYLMTAAGRPDFKRLYARYVQTRPQGLDTVLLTA